MNPHKDKKLREFISSMSKEEIEKNNLLQIEQSKKEFKAFLEDLKIGKCYLCGGEMNGFDEQKPCFHWFTYPSNIRKKHFKKYLKNPIGFYQLDSYFRWLANSETPIININDLKDETSKTSFIETTFKYKNIEWAFSIGHTDVEGHQNGKVGDKPHFHIQMKVDERMFLQFNDFHIPFSDTDLFNFELFEQAGDLIKHEHLQGQGISIIENQEMLEILDNTMRITDDIENAPFHRQTIIEASEGETISGDVIFAAIEESKRTKEPIAKIMKRLLSSAKITSIISPGEGIPKMTKRSGKK